MQTYYDKEIESLKLHEGAEFKPTMQIYAPNGNKTKHFSVTREQVEKIRLILNEGENTEQKPLTTWDKQSDALEACSKAQAALKAAQDAFEIAWLEYIAERNPRP